MEENQPNHEENKSAFDLLQSIKCGALDPKTLDKDQRQICVEALCYDAGSTATIAQLLKVSDRTIRRDMEEIHCRNALTPNPALAANIVGEFVMSTRVSRAYLSKLAHDKSASIGERSQAAYYAHMVLSDMMKMLQSMGYLSKSADALLVMQAKEADESNDQMSALLAELEDMSKLEDSPEAAQKLIDLKKTITNEEKTNETK